MQRTRRPTLTQWLIEERRRFPSATGGFNSLVLDVATACKAIAKAVSLSNLETNDHAAAELELFSHEAFLHFNRDNESIAGLLSNELPAHHADEHKRGEHLLTFDPLVGSSNIDINAPVGSIFSVLHAPSAGKVEDAHFLQKGSEQVAAGYALYGPATMLVLSVGTGVNAFTLDPTFGDFTLTHRDLRVPSETSEFAINASNSRFWELPVKRYVGECLAGTTGPRGKDFNMRWIASMVADAHRLLLRGGVFLYPFDTNTSSSETRPHLLYGANPIGYLVEQAGGRASTGDGPLLDVQPTSLHQRTGLVFGSRSEVERIENYHAEPNTSISSYPLFNDRGLFRD
jgi:fructose-1,6-bisphosphatase I/sedoheptulose-1,7-bisphosphatase